MDIDIRDADRERRREETKKFWRVWKTANEMLEERGYLIVEGNKTISFEEFEKQYPGGREQANIIVSHVDDREGSRCLVVFAPVSQGGGSVSNKIMEEYRNQMVSTGADTLVVVHPGKVTTQAKDFAQRLDKGMTVQFFHENELLVNIMNHTLVPKHIVLKPEEKNKLLERYKLRESQLPRMLSLDPVAKFLGLKRGQVVKIIRASETAGRYITYRLVV